MLDLYAKSLLLVVGVGVCLMQSAGDWSWSAGWCLFGAYGAFVLLAFRYVDPQLLKERASPSPGYDRWDALLAAVGFLLLYPAALIVAGIDAKRFAWSPPPLILAQACGGGMFVVGYGVALWAMRANRFFTTFVRIQSERDHSLVDSGPYAVVRHPGYAGMLLAHLGLPLLLGSRWAWVPVLLGGAVFVVRTAREEHVLSAGLKGFKEYQARVPWRLLPGVW